MTTTPPRVSRTFRILTVVTLVLMLSGTALTLAAVVLVWVPGDLPRRLYADDIAVHRFHAIVISAGTWVLFVSVVSQLFKPRRKLATMVLAVAALVISLPFDLNSPLFSPLELVVLALLVAMLWFHPGRGSWQWRPLHRAGAAVLALGAVPWLTYAWQQLSLQLTQPISNRHAELGHYGFMAGGTLIVLVAAGLGVAALPGWRWATALGAGAAALFGVASMVLPDAVSSGGTEWGLAAVLWSGALVASGVVRSEAVGSSSVPSISEPPPAGM